MPTMTIPYTAAQGARLAKAFKVELGLAVDATEAQVRGAVVNYLIEVVRRQEVREAKRLAREAANTVAPIDLS